MTDGLDHVSPFPEADDRLLSFLIDQANDAFFITDPATGRVLYGNDKACANLGCSDRELLALHVFDFCENVRSREEWNRSVEEICVNGASLFETTHRRQDGSLFPVEVNVRCLSIGGASYLISVVRDITERKVAERKVQEALNKVDAVIAAISEGITVQDRSHRILYQNRIHKARQGSHVGELCYEAYHGRDRVCEGCLLVKCFEDGNVHSREMSADTDQGVIYLEVVASPLLDADGTIVGGVEVVRDITERRLLENQLRHAQKLEAVGRLAGGIAHDFNNILTAIIGYGSIALRNAGDDESIRRPLQNVLASAERAANLTRGLLTFSRKEVLHPRPTDLNSIVQDIRRIVPPIIGERIEMDIRLNEAPLSIRAGKEQLEQVVLNLVVNARDAMPDGGRLTVSTRQVALDHTFSKVHGFGKPGSYALLTVADTGTGISEENRAKIFEPFFTTKEVGKGTGLGLSISYGIVKQHEGYILCRSELGKGATFEIYLPLISGIPAPNEPTPQPPLRGGSETVLVAEDNDSVRETVRTLLTQHGYTVIEAANGSEAVSRIRESGERIRLIVLDVIMPGMNGKQVYEHIRRDRPGMPVVFMSGYSGDVLTREDILSGEIPFVAKPVLPSDLLQKVRTALDSI